MKVSNMKNVTTIFKNLNKFLHWDFIFLMTIFLKKNLELFKI